MFAVCIFRIQRVPEVLVRTYGIPMYDECVFFDTPCTLFILRCGTLITITFGNLVILKRFHVYEAINALKVRRFI